MAHSSVLSGRSILGLIAVSLASTAAFAAEPILVPTFTPGSPAEFGVSVMLQEQVVQELLGAGHIVLTSEVVAPVLGPDAVANCAVTPSCPTDVLPKIPARVALVVSVARSNGVLTGHMELWEQSRPTPLESRDIAIPPGNEQQFVIEVSTAASNLLAVIEPSPDAVLMAAARLISGQGPAQPMPEAPRPVPVAPGPVAPRPVAPPKPIVIQDLDSPEGKAPAPKPTVPAPGVAPTHSLKAPAAVPQRSGQDRRTSDGGPHTAPTAELIEGTGVKPRHLVGSEAAFRKSGDDPRDWVYRKMPHAGRVAIEVHGGIGIGDVDRAADMRVERAADGTVLNAWYQEGPQSARRVRGQIFLGYSPATFMDFGVMLGLQYGNRYYSTGVRQNQPDGTVNEVVAPRQPAQAVQFIAQPRLRFYVAPLGPAKPYIFGGADFRGFDAYKLEQPADYSYATPAAGFVPGALGGAGLMIDPGPIVGFFAEGAYIQHFGVRSAPAENTSWAFDRPEPPAGVKYTITITGGVQFRL